MPGKTDHLDSRVSVTTHLTQQAARECVTVLLATARVRIMDRFGAPHEVRALVDPGSETSLITEALVQRLRVPRSASSVSIIGVGERCTGVTRGRVDVEIYSRQGAPITAVTALVLPQLTCYWERFRSDARSWPHVKGLELADPEYLKQDTIDLLLGAEVYSRIILKGLQKSGLEEPIAQNTLLGWVVSGPVGAASPGPSVAVMQCLVDNKLSDAVRRFWEQEEIARGPTPMSRKEEQCVNHFSSTHSRLADGRYVVRLPVFDTLPDLADTRRAALSMMQATERRFRRDPQFQKLYEDFMAEYENLDHMTPVAYQTGSDERKGCYLPHRGVLKETSLSTKLRVVFNGSQKNRQGQSLNDCLLVGPNLLPRLDDVISRWRRHRYVCVADVEKMY